MILIIDFRKDKSCLLLADQSGVRSFSAGRGEGFVQLNEVLAELGDAKPVGIAVVLPTKDTVESDRMSWSTVRAAVSLGNSLGFAWDVPVVRLSGGAVADLPVAARNTLRDANPEDRVSAHYDGEPNITKPKSTGSSE